MKNSLLVLVALITLSTSHSSCSNEDSSDRCGLVGTWCLESTEYCILTWEFRDNGNFLQAGINAYDWTTQNNCGKIILNSTSDPDGLAEQEVNIISISNDEFVCNTTGFGTLVGELRFQRL